MSRWTLVAFEPVRGGGWGVWGRMDEGFSSGRPVDLSRRPQGETQGRGGD